MEPTNTSNKRKIFLSVLAVLFIAGVIAAVMFLVTRPKQSDFQTANTQVTEVKKARDALTPAVNTYLAAYKTAYNESKSTKQATLDTKAEHDAFTQAASEATQAMTDLSKNRIANDSDAGKVVRQLQNDYQAEVTYYTGLVESYPEFTGLFAEGNQSGCSGVFVGEADGLTERKKKLDAAAAKCFMSLESLKKSSNLTYVDYAKKIERRVTRLQSDIAETVKAEQNLKQYEVRAEEYRQQYAEATARGASEQEIQKLADELKVFNAQIADNKAGFDFASQNYLSTVF